MTPQVAEVELISERELEESLSGVLKDLGLTLEELRAQAESGHFVSNKARTVWLSIRKIVS